MAEAKTADMVEDADHTAMLEEITKRMAKSKGAISVVKPGRMLLKEGVLSKKGQESLIKRSNKRLCFLFDDMLLLTKQESGTKLTFKNEIELASATVRDLAYTAKSETPSPDHAWEVITPTKTFMLYADNEDDKHEWMSAIVGAIVTLAEYRDPSSTGTPGWRHHKKLGTLFSAAVTGNEGMARSLCGLLDVAGEAPASIDVNDVDEDGLSPLHYAALSGHPEILRLLLTHLAPVDSTTLDGRMMTPLHLAVLHGNVEAAKVLCDNEASVSVGDVGMRTPLHVLLESSDPDATSTVPLIKLLCDWSADPNALDARGFAPMHLLARTDFVDAMPPLLKAHGNPNLEVGDDAGADLSGMTPLHLACSDASCLNARMVSSLLQCGAQPNLLTRDGRSAMHLLVEAGMSAAMAGASSGTTASAGAGAGAGAGGGARRVSKAVSLSPVQVRVEEALKMMAMFGARLDVAIGGVGNGSGASVEATLVKSPFGSLTGQLRSAASAYQAKAPGAGSKIGGPPHHRVCNKRHEQADDFSQTCVLCRSKWTFTNRRHHCRSCGKLVCGDCSSKKYPLMNAAGAARDESRVCDGCFNRFCSEFSAMTARGTATTGTGAGTGSGSGSGARPKTAPSAGGDRAELLGDRDSRGGAAAKRRDDGRVASARAGAGDAATAVGDARDAVALRGEKIKRLDEKIERLNEQSKDFYEAAKAIRQQAERDARGGWGR